MIATPSMRFLGRVTPFGSRLHRSLRLGCFAKRIQRAGQYRKAFSISHAQQFAAAHASRPMDRRDLPPLPRVGALPATDGALALAGFSARHRAVTHFFEAQQHGEHPFELAVQMDLVAAQSLQLVHIE